MPRAKALTLSDLSRRGLPRLEVACTACDRRGVYGIAGLIKRNGDAKLTELLVMLTVECPRRNEASSMEPCGAYYPALMRK